MKLLNLFWFFLDGDKSSAEIIASKKQQPVQQVKSEEASIGVEADDFDDQEFEEMFD